MSCACSWSLIVPPADTFTQWRPEQRLYRTILNKELFFKKCTYFTAIPFINKKRENVAFIV